jgi:hypothetical protein
LRLVERKLTDGAELITRQRQLIVEMKGRNGDTASAQRTLRNFEMVQGLLERLRDRIYDERERRRP